MRPVHFAGDNIISSLGWSTSINMSALQSGQVGIKPVSDPSLFPSPVPLALIDAEQLEDLFQTVLKTCQQGVVLPEYTRLEKMLICSVHDAISQHSMSFSDTRILFVLSTTKGNIHLLEKDAPNLFPPSRKYLWETARVIGDFFGFANQPLIISNACISGIMALTTAFRYLRRGLYDQAVVTGGDILSEFVISGFQSFQSLSPTPCRPYDAARNGLSLGEAAGTVVLTTGDIPLSDRPIRITGSAITNDANHISGPSRTGEELGTAMRDAMQEAALLPAAIGFINAHGTATPFNDEMESKAISFAGLLEVPVNSFKGSWGHTLGAAGLIESIASVHSLRNQLLLRTAGFETPGVPEPIRVIAANEPKPMKSCLKSASGFGGCNAAIIFETD